MDRVAAVIINAGAGHGIAVLPPVQQWVKDVAEGKRDTTTQPLSGWWEKEGLPTTNPEILKSRLGNYYFNKILAEDEKRIDKTNFANFKGYPPMRENHDLLKKLGESVPVLVMIGANESQVELFAQYELHKAIPNSEFISCYDCYHSNPKENPDIYNSRVHEFLKRAGL